MHNTCYIIAVDDFQYSIGASGLTAAKRHARREMDAWQRGQALRIYEETVNGPMPVSKGIVGTRGWTDVK